MLNAENSLLLIIDIQEKLLNAVFDKSCGKNAEILAKSAQLLEIPTVITEQYPKGLGSTVEDLKNSASDAKYFEKVSFSALEDEELVSYLKQTGRKSVILCGIEAHICVLQTAIALKEHGFDVYFVENASGSRNLTDFTSAVKFLRHEGIKVLNTESILFLWLKSSENPCFKAVQALIK